MTEQMQDHIEKPMKIAGKCKCGNAIWNEMLWIVRIGKGGSGYCVPFGYCPYCGCYLDPNGYAHEMVRADQMARARDEAIRLLTTLRDGEVGKAMIARERNAVRWVIALLDGSAEEEDADVRDSE